MNLCINARDAMPDGGKLTITTRNVSREEAYKTSHGQLRGASYVLLSVRDTGVGMDTKTLNSIFEPFFTTKEVGKGTGLGLAMVHGIVGQHNGYVDVKSTVGKGTVFNVYLPALDVASTTVSSDLPDERPQVSVESGTETLLIVEDDTDLRYLMQEALEDDGYRALTARDGEEGLHVFEEHQSEIALVVSDLMTPNMPGKDLYDEVRSRRAATKFLFVSGYPADQISENFVLDKGFEFLQKPFDLDELAVRVAGILAQKEKAKV